MQPRLDVWTRDPAVIRRDGARSSVPTLATSLPPLIDLEERRSLTMISISHDLALVHHLCSDVVVMRAGEIVEGGKPADMLFDLENPYIHAPLAAVPGRKKTA